MKQGREGWIRGGNKRQNIIKCFIHNLSTLHNTWYPVAECKNQDTFTQVLEYNVKLLK